MAVNYCTDLYEGENVCRSEDNIHLALNVMLTNTTICSSLYNSINVMLVKDALMQVPLGKIPKDTDIVSIIGGHGIAFLYISQVLP